MQGEECRTGKVCYPSHDAAMRAVRNIKRFGDRKNSGTPSRAFLCQDCRWYHTTSWASKEDWEDEWN